MKVSRNLLEFLLALVCFIITIIPIIIFFLLLLLSELFRQFLIIYLNRKHKQKIQLLNGCDAVFAITGQSVEVINNAVLIFQGQTSAEQIKHVVSKSWTHSKHNNTFMHPKLRSRIAKLWGYYYWFPEENFSIDDHVQSFHCKPPDNETEFYNIVSTICNQHLLTTISPWMIFTFPIKYGAYSNQPHYAIIIRMHHCINDGFSSMRMISDCFVDEKTVQFLKPKIPQVSSLSKMITFLIAVIYSPLLIALYAFRKDVNILHGPKQSGRRLRRLSSFLPLDRVKRVGKLTGTTVNDILTASITGALKQYYAKEGATLVKPVQVYIPVSMTRSMKRFELSNNTTSFIIKLPMNNNYTVLERLKKVQEEILKQKNSYFYLTTYLIVKYVVNRMPEMFTRLMSEVTGATFVITNVPGFQTECLNKYGDKLKICTGFPTHCFQIGFGISISSYNGNLLLAMSADMAVIDNAKAVDWFLKTCIEEFEKLEQTVNCTTNGVS